MTQASKTSVTTNILIVEDQMVIALFLDDLLDDLGYRVSGIARNGREAESLALAEHPGIAMVDVSVTAARDGVDIARDLVEKYGTKIIFMSGHDDVAEWPEVMALCPVAVLSKPCLPARIEAALRIAAAPDASA